MELHKYFYGGSPHAVEASKPQMLEHAKELQALITAKGHDIELVAVNKLYKGSCICCIEGRMHHYTIYEELIRRECEFRGYGGDAWEQAPNYVKLEDLEQGQMELF
ncbi:hypothetical protein KZ483_24165 [Paenibacillus sp. sptzw28]|uniref:hypothetical protein n=1 Tax=Paenibacillus sp. sptzw28 TaxID=715179 RepID=UPI001C6E4E67|nr:hypothetical protein [Paenibacillus sp. sptzw28]QYR20817.1 hypothetical protein KZ483_24165 [Paenibacillus sp. sptzw28]